jgi:hypothetical protein
MKLEPSAVGGTYLVDDRSPTAGARRSDAAFRDRVWVVSAIHHL